MANCEEAKNCKPEVTSSSPPQVRCKTTFGSYILIFNYYNHKKLLILTCDQEQEQQQQQQTSHVYPDWGAMQVYYIN